MDLLHGSTWVTCSGPVAQNEPEWPMMTQKWGHPMADRAGSPRIVGHLLISWDSLGQWIFRVAQNDRHRHITLSEIRRKNRHSVPVCMDGFEP
jgi:hypothetical protein